MRTDTLVLLWVDVVMLYWGRRGEGAITKTPTSNCQAVTLPLSHPNWSANVNLVQQKSTKAGFNSVDLQHKSISPRTTERQTYLELINQQWVISLTNDPSLEHIGWLTACKIKCQWTVNLWNCSSVSAYSAHVCSCMHVLNLLKAIHATHWTIQLKIIKNKWVDCMS